jgi:hypothetical protein
VGKPISLRLWGRAKIGGREVQRPAVAAEDMMQAFLWRHLVPSQELLVAVMGRGRFRAPLQIMVDDPVLIPAGCMTQLHVSLAAALRGRGRGRRAGRGTGSQFKVELSKPPAGVAIFDVSRSRTGLDITLCADAAKIQPGTQGNLIFQVFSVPPAPPPKAPARRRQVRRRLLATLPAVRFEIVAQ